MIRIQTATPPGFALCRRFCRWADHPFIERPTLKQQLPIVLEEDDQ